MNLQYNTILPDSNISGIDSDEFIELLGPERLATLESVLLGKNPDNTIGIDISDIYQIFYNVVSNLPGYSLDVDINTVFKIIIEYMVLFKLSLNPNSLGEYLCNFLMDDDLALEISMTTDLLFKDFIVKTDKLESRDETLVPYHWDDKLHKLIVLRV